MLFVINIQFCYNWIISWKDWHQRRKNQFPCCHFIKSQNEHAPKGIIPRCNPSFLILEEIPELEHKLKAKENLTLSRQIWQPYSCTLRLLFAKYFALLSAASIGKPSQEADISTFMNKTFIVIKLQHSTESWTKFQSLQEPNIAVRTLKSLKWSC